MKKEIGTRVLNMVLRGLSMGSRFILIIALAKLLPPSELGEYGLLVVSITFCVLMLGAEFHTYIMREINTNPPERWSFIVQHHAVAQALLLIAVIPLAVLIFQFDMLSDGYVYWFLCLLVIELLNQEINWLLISMHKQILASLVMFVRFGIWVYVVLPVMYMNTALNNIESVLYAWAIGGGSAILLGAAFIWKTVPAWKIYNVDREWVIKGFKVGLYFLLAAISLRGLFTFDRYTVESLGSSDELGVYVFYIGVVMGVLGFLEPAVFTFIYPKMIKSYHKNNKEEYLRLFKELAVSTGLLSVFLAGAIWLLMPYLIQWVNKPIYSEYYDSLIVLIVMGVIYVVGMIPHYGLYSMKKDKWIVGAQISSVIVYVAVIYFYENDVSIMTVAVGLLAAFSWMVVVKLFGYKRAKQNSFLVGKGGA